MNATRCVWEVTAGIVPGQPLPQYTRRWVVDANEWYGDDGQPTPQGVALFNAHLVAAQEYARMLSDPRMLNWVRVDYLWM